MARSRGGNAKNAGRLRKRCQIKKKMLSSFRNFLANKAFATQLPEVPPRFAQRWAGKRT